MPFPFCAGQRRLAALALVLILGLSGCSDGATGPRGSRLDDELRRSFDLRELGPTPYPPDGRPSAARVALGRVLFFDPILSGEKDVACATCHHPSLGFADGRSFSVGAGGEGLGPNRRPTGSRLTGLPIDLEPRNSPTVLNAALNAEAAGVPSDSGLQFWDGRVLGLEEQARQPLASRTEMAGDAYAPEVALDSVVARLRAIPEYVRLFREAFPDQESVPADTTIVSMDTYGRAIAAFERELVTRETAFDAYARGDDRALDDRQKLGLQLFFTKARCALCHSGPMFSDYRFRVLGVPQTGDGKDVIPGDDTGREEHTLERADRYAFRTPTLRNVALTAPYMHDGVFATLEEVVRFYNDGARPRHPGVSDATVDESVRDPLGLSDEEMTALVAFLRGLTDPGRGVDPALLIVPATVPSGLAPVFGDGKP